MILSVTSLVKSGVGRCRIEQEQEEKAVRAIKSARKNEERRQSKEKDHLIIETQ